uniref:Uncharacterized protein n=1 Tax=Physcomitrium patens TaxID=3218 RepID=A0A2K1KDW9_PHYPA|nr:hypothetical protein PHYPA_008351 [Physcomitrium patens]
MKQFQVGVSQDQGRISTITGLLLERAKSERRQAIPMSRTLYTRQISRCLLLTLNLKVTEIDLIILTD